MAVIPRIVCKQQTSGVHMSNLNYGGYHLNCDQKHPTLLPSPLRIKGTLRFISQQNVLVILRLDLLDLNILKEKDSF